MGTEGVEAKERQGEEIKGDEKEGIHRERGKKI